MAPTKGKRARNATVVADYTADTADRHELYGRSVQEVDAEVRFIDDIFQHLRGRAAGSLREDFCGTALLSAEWVRVGPERRATGIDLDPEPLAWGERRLAKLDHLAERVTLCCADVRSVQVPPVDVIAALNFSYSLLHERSELLSYLRRVRGALHDDGLFVLDFHAGPRSQEELIEETEYDGFTYVWEQGEMNALSGRAARQIHFRFPDGSELESAFSYDFRIWTLPELRDLLDEAGFEAAHVYFEDFDEDGNTIGAVRKVQSIAHEDSWIGYVVAEPGPRLGSSA